MRLRDVLAMSELRLRLLYEPPGATEAVISRPFTTDLLDPSRYLIGGELVLSGLMWRRADADSELFVAALVGGRATALAAGEGLLEEVPDDVVAACRRRGLALVAVPADVSFADVTERISAAVAQRPSDSGGRLLAAVAAGATLDEVVRQCASDSGLMCRILTPSGRQVVAGAHPLPDDELDVITRAYLRADRFPAVTGGRIGKSYSLFRVGPVSGHRLDSWLVLVDGRWTDWAGGTVALVEELAAVAALDRVRRAEGARALRGVVGDALTLAGAGGNPREIAGRLRQAGLDPAAEVVVVVADFAGRPDLLDVARALLDDLVGAVDRAAVLTGSDGRAVALVQHDHPGLTELLRRSFARFAPGLGRTRLAVGVSRPGGAEALAGAVEQARYARRLAELRAGEVSVVTGDELTSAVLLLATVPDQVRRAFAEQVLGRVLDYDERNDSGLRETLDAFLSCSGSWNRTAELLHVHVNTVRYRIDRVAELTGKDLSRLEDRVDVFLALRSL